VPSTAWPTSLANPQRGADAAASPIIGAVQDGPVFAGASAGSGRGTGSARPPLEGSLDRGRSRRGRRWRSSETGGPRAHGFGRKAAADPHSRALEGCATMASSAHGDDITGRTGAARGCRSAPALIREQGLRSRVPAAGRTGCAHPSRANSHCRLRERATTVHDKPCKKQNQYAAGQEAAQLAAPLLP